MNQKNLRLDMASLLGFRLLDEEKVDGSMRLGSKISTKGGMKPGIQPITVGSKIGAKEGFKPSIGA